MDQFRPICVRILVLLFVLRPCDFEEKVNLIAVVGSSLTFSDPVKEIGFFIFEQKTIASVLNGAFDIYENIYLNRLHWSSSGHITLSNLQKNDSGVYSIDSKRGTVFTKKYELKLYDPVSVPVVSCVTNMSMDSLSLQSLQCSVTQTEQTTLSLFRGEQPLDNSSSGVLLFTVPRQDYNITYKCVAQNPADTKTVNVNITSVCKSNETQSGENTSETNNASLLITISVLGIVVVLCLGCLIKKILSKKETPELQTQGHERFQSIRKLCTS